MIDLKICKCKDTLLIKRHYFLAILLHMVVHTRNAELLSYLRHSFIIGTMEKLTEKNGQKYNDFGGIRVWETRTGKPIANLPIQKWVGQVGFLPNSRFAFTSDYNGIAFWDLLREKKIHQQKMPEKINSTTTSGKNMPGLLRSEKRVP